MPRKFRIILQRCRAVSLPQHGFFVYAYITVFTVLLYGCETWTILAADERCLEAFQMKCQRQITKVRWQDHYQELRGGSAHRSGVGVGLSSLALFHYPSSVSTPGINPKTSSTHHLQFHPRYVIS